MTKGELHESGSPTNSMATGNPKDPPAPIGTSLTAIASSGVAVAAMVESAGGIEKAAESITQAAVAAAAEKAAAVVAEYSVKLVALPTSIPVRIAGYTGARVGKTKSDKNRNGEAYDPVKLSISDFLSTKTKEEKAEEETTQQDNDKLNKKTEESTKKIKAVMKKVQEKIAKSAEVIAEIMTHTLEGVEWLQQNIDKEVARVEANVRSELDEAFKKMEDDIDNFAENEGDKIGAKIVEQYNKTVQAAAKNIEDKKNKSVSKAKIKANAAIQKAKLKIFAMIGL